MVSPCTQHIQYIIELIINIIGLHPDPETRQSMPSQLKPTSSLEQQAPMNHTTLNNGPMSHTRHNPSCCHAVAGVGVPAKLLFTAAGGQFIVIGACRGYLALKNLQTICEHNQREKEREASCIWLILTSNAPAAWCDLYPEPHNKQCCDVQRQHRHLKLATTQSSSTNTQLWYRVHKLLAEVACQQQAEFRQRGCRCCWACVECRAKMQKGVEGLKGRLPACEGQLTMW